MIRRSSLRAHILSVVTLALASCQGMPALAAPPASPPPAAAVAANQPMRVAPNPAAAMNPDQRKALEQMSPEQRADVMEAYSKLQPGGKMSVEVLNKDDGSVYTIEYGKGTGAGVESDADKLSDKFTGSPPAVAGTNGQKAAGGGAEHEVDAEQNQPKPKPWDNPLFWIGIALFAAAGAVFYFKVPDSKELIPILCGAGGGCMVVAFYPAVLIYVACGLIVWLAGPYIWAKIQKIKAEQEAEKNKEALRATLAGAHDPSLPQDLRDKVQSKIDFHSEVATGDAKTISSVMQADQLGPFAPKG